MPKLTFTDPCRIPPEPIWYNIHLPIDTKDFSTKKTSPLSKETEKEKKINKKQQGTLIEKEELSSSFQPKVTSKTRLTSTSTPITSSSWTTKLTSLDSSSFVDWTEIQKEAYEIGWRYLQDDVQLYEKFQSQHNSSQAHMHKLFLKGGTLADKISVLTLSIQHSPVHNLTALEKLVHLVTKKNRKEALMALSALKDLFTGTGFLSTSSSNFSTNHQHMKNKKQHPVNHEKTLGGGGGGLLPSNRRLLPFHLQPIPFHEHDHALKKDKSSSTLSSSDLNEKKWWPQWALYVFEDHLKKLYYQFVCALEQLLKDPLLHIKQQALDCVMALLVHGPEQEVNLLQLCIHKLGDPMSKLAALTSHKLLTLIHVHHPAMKPVVFEACRLFLLNETTPLRAHYYTLITLNQFKLSAKEPEFVQTLVHFYFQKLLHQFQMTEHLKVESKKLRKMTKVAKKKKQRIQKRHGGLQVPSTTTSSKLPSTPVLPPKLTQLETLKLQHETLMKRTKVLSAILTGLHRALPYLQLSTFPKTWLPHVDLLFQWTRHSDLVLQLHALHVLYLLQRHPLPRRYFTPFCTSLHQYLLKLTYSPMVPQHVQSMTLTFLKQVFFHLFPPSESPYATTPRNPQNGKSKVTRPSEEEGDDEEDAPKSTTLLGLVSCLLTLCLHHSHPGFVMAVLQCLFTTVFRRHPWVWHNLHLMAPSVQEEVSKVSLQVSLSTPFFQVSMLAHHMHPSIRWYIQHRFLGRPSPHHGLPSSSSSSSSSTVMNPKEDDEDASDPFSTYAFLPFLDTFISKKLKIPVPSHPSSSSSSLEDPRRPLPFSHARKVNMEPSVGSHVHPSHQQGSGVDGHQRAYVEFLEPFHELQQQKQEQQRSSSSSATLTQASTTSLVSSNTSNDDLKNEDVVEQAILKSMSKNFGVAMDEDEDDDEDDDDDEWENEEEDDDVDAFTFSDDEDDDEDDDDEEENEKGSSKRRHSSNPSLSFKLSGTPFASAKEYSKLLESQAGLEDEMDDLEGPEDVDDEDDDDEDNDPATPSSRGRRRRPLSSGPSSSKRNPPRTSPSQATSSQQRKPSRPSAYKKPTSQGHGSAALGKRKRGHGKHASSSSMKSKFGKKRKHW